MILVIKVDKNKPTSFQYKTSYEQTTFKEVDIWNRRFKSPDHDVQLTQQNTGTIPLAENKKKDLKELCTMKIIPKV